MDYLPPLLANAFSEVIHRWLTPAEIAEANRQNKIHRGCATHDYCDANMAMNEAFERVMLREFVFYDEDLPHTEKLNEQDTDLLNAAWDLARENEFKQLLLH
jgi:hypothetical protein